jgi:outer membrane lipoprotein SlyB
MNTKLLLCLPLTLFFTSCAQDSLTGNTYSRNDASQMQAVNRGRITEIRYVKIEGGNTAGTVVGGLAGGALGSNLGGGRTANTAGAIGGALLGGVAGSHAQQAVQSRNGIEITVKLDNGNSVAVVQELKGSESFKVGDRVRVLSSGGRPRVSY